MPPSKFPRARPAATGEIEIAETKLLDDVLTLVIGASDHPRIRKALA
jgi:hypothetical protein